MAGDDAKAEALRLAREHKERREEDRKLRQQVSELGSEIRDRKKTIGLMLDYLRRIAMCERSGSAQAKELQALKERIVSLERKIMN